MRTLAVLLAVALVPASGCVPHVPLVPGDPTLPGFRGYSRYTTGDLHRVVVAEPGNATLDSASFVYGALLVPLARVTGPVEVAGGRVCRSADQVEVAGLAGPAWAWSGAERVDATSLRVRRDGVDYESAAIHAPNAAIESVYVTDLVYDPATDSFEGTLRLFAQADKGAPCVATKAGAIRLQRARPRLR